MKSKFFLQNKGQCIMLNNNNFLIKISHGLIAFLFLLSFIAYHSDVSAEDLKIKTAQEYKKQGEAEEDKGNLPGALSFYKKAISLGLKDAQLYNEAGILSEQAGMLKQAEKYYLEAIRENEKFLPAYMNLGYLYKRLGNKELALKYFKKRFELAEFNDPWAEKAKAEILQIAPNYKKWFQAIEVEQLNREMVRRAREELNQNLMFAEECYKDGMKKMQQKEYKKALESFQQGLEFTPNNPKLIEAKKEAEQAIFREKINEHKERAERFLDSGSYLSANREIQKILTMLQNKPKQLPINNN